MNIFKRKSKVPLGQSKLVVPSAGNVMSLKIGDSLYENATFTDGTFEASLVSTQFVPVIEKALLEAFDKDLPPPSLHQLVLCIDQAARREGEKEAKIPEDAEIIIEVPFSEKTESFTFSFEDFEDLEWRREERPGWVLRTLFVMGDSPVVDDADFGTIHVFDVSDETPHGFVDTITVKASGLNRVGGKPFGEEKLILVETLPNLEITDEIKEEVAGPGQNYTAAVEDFVLPDDEEVETTPSRFVRIVGGDVFTESEGEAGAYVSRETEFASVIESFYVHFFAETGSPLPGGCYTVVRVYGEDEITPQKDDLEVKLTFPMTGEEPLEVTVTAAEAVDAPGPSVEFRFLLVSGHNPDISEIPLPDDWNIILVDVTDDAGIGFPPYVDVAVPVLEVEQRLVLVETLPDLEIADEPATGEAGPGETFAAPAETDTETAWLEIELLDDAGKPQAGVLCSVRPFNGSGEIVGALDARGTARIEGLSPGMCTIIFPEIDEGDW